MKARSAWAIAAVVLAPAICFAAVIASPKLLLFPYKRQVGETLVYSEASIPAQIEAVIRRSDDLVAKSELFEPEVLSHTIYLTQGGWRWRLLSFDVSRAFGQQRALGGNLVLNRSDIATDKVWNGFKIAGERALSDVIAHERTHSLIRKRFGLLADSKYPVWVREGYCDHVAQSSSLSDVEAARLTAGNIEVPALRYHQARKRVEAALESNGNSVAKLFSASLED